MRKESGSFTVKIRLFPFITPFFDFPVNPTSFISYRHSIAGA